MVRHGNNMTKLSQLLYYREAAAAPKSRSLQRPATDQVVKSQSGKVQLDGHLQTNDQTIDW